MLSKVRTEIPHFPTIDNEDRNYDQILIQHPLFNRNQSWYLGRRSIGTPCRCSGYLRPRIVQRNDLHFYIQGPLFLPKEWKVVDTTLRFCLSAQCALMGSLVWTTLSSFYLNKKSWLIRVLKQYRPEKMNLRQGVNINLENLTITQ